MTVCKQRHNTAMSMAVCKHWLVFSSFLNRYGKLMQYSTQDRRFRKRCRKKLLHDGDNLNFRDTLVVQGRRKSIGLIMDY